jgi:hypothetical protein
MKDCTTFLKLQEASLNKQAEAKWQGYEGNMNNAPATNKETVELLRAKINQTRDATTTKDMFYLRGTLQQ